VIVVVWDRVVIGILQKLLGMPKFGTLLIGAFLNDGVISDEEKKSIDTAMAKNITLVSISVLVAGAINAGWFLIVLVQTFASEGVFFPVGVLLIALHLVLGSAYVRMSLKLSRPDDYPAHLKLNGFIEKWAHRLYNGSIITSIAAPLIALVLICGYFFLSQHTASTWWNDFRSNIGRGGNVVNEKMQDGVEWLEGEEATPIQKTSQPVATPKASKAGSETVDCGRHGQIRKGKVEKDKASIKCTAAMNSAGIYPCTCK
jgi:hypothetical protein